MVAVVHRTLSKLKSLSEFIGGSRAACGPDGELMALDELATTGSILNADHLVAIQKRDQVKGWFSPTGGEPLSSIYKDLNTYEHIHFVRYIPYSDTPNTTVIHGALQDFAGTYPIVLQLVNAQALTGNEQGVHSHFVAVVGIDSDLGYYVLNGDDIQALPISRGVTTYPGRWISWNSILNAKPAGLIVFGRNSVNIPTGWTDDGTTLKAPNGIPVVQGFRDWVLNHTWESINYPLAPEVVITTGSIEPGNPSIGPGSRQNFRLTSLGWTTAKNVYVIWVGQDIVALEKELANASHTDLSAIISDAENVGADVQVVINSLDDLITKLKAV